jgi:hypothetical protein
VVVAGGGVVGVPRPWPSAGMIVGDSSIEMDSSQAEQSNRRVGMISNSAEKKNTPGPRASGWWHEVGRLSVPQVSPVEQPESTCCVRCSRKAACLREAGESDSLENIRSS